MLRENEEAETGHALILVPNADARVQDLGSFRSGRQMETDILEGSALVCRANSAWEMKSEDGRVRFAFEGNAYGAVNLESFYGRLRSAAGRLVQNYPSIAYGTALQQDLTPVARFDLDRMAFVEIMDAARLAEWAGEPASTICPPVVATPCDDPAVLSPLLKGETTPIITDPSSVMIWRLTNGQLLVHRPSAPSPSICLWSMDDPGFRRIFDSIPAARLVGWERQAVFGRDTEASPPGPSI